MPKLRYYNPQGLKEYSMNLLSEGLQDFVACQGQQSPLASSSSLLPARRLGAQLSVRSYRP
eukprot:1151622-Pelagomonas_calceolata.AAC.1